MPLQLKGAVAEGTIANPVVQAPRPIVQDLGGSQLSKLGIAIAKTSNKLNAAIDQIDAYNLYEAETRELQEGQKEVLLEQDPDLFQEKSDQLLIRLGVARDKERSKVLSQQGLLLFKQLFTLGLIAVGGNLRKIGVNRQIAKAIDGTAASIENAVREAGNDTGVTSNTKLIAIDTIFDNLNPDIHENIEQRRIEAFDRVFVARAVLAANVHPSDTLRHLDDNDLEEGLIVYRPGFPPRPIHLLSAKDKEMIRGIAEAALKQDQAANDRFATLTGEADTLEVRQIESDAVTEVIEGDFDQDQFLVNNSKLRGHPEVVIRIREYAHLWQKREIEGAFDDPAQYNKALAAIYAGTITRSFDLLGFDNITVGPRRALEREFRAEQARIRTEAYVTYYAGISAGEGWLRARLGVEIPVRTIHDQENVLAGIAADIILQYNAEARVIYDDALANNKEIPNGYDVAPRILNKFIEDGLVDVAESDERLLFIQIKQFLKFTLDPEDPTRPIEDPLANTVDAFNEAVRRGDISSTVGLLGKAALVELQRQRVGTAEIAEFLKVPDPSLPATPPPKKVPPPKQEKGLTDQLETIMKDLLRKFDKLIELGKHLNREP